MAVPRRDRTEPAENGCCRANRSVGTVTALLRPNAADALETTTTMQTKTIVGGLVILGAMLSSTVASARGTVFVHGRNNGSSDVNDYWHVGYGANNDGVYGFNNNGAEQAYTYSYDATASWKDVSTNTKPVCALTSALNAAPGTDFAIITHSAGGMAAVYLLALAQNGTPTSCSVSPATAKTWMTYVISNAAPFRGAQVADAVYGGTSGNWLQHLCSSVAGSVANLLFNQQTPMTYSLTRSYMGSNFSITSGVPGLTNYGAYGSLYQQAGWGRNGDDSLALGTAQSCAGEEGNNDGFVSANSAMGNAKGTALDSFGHFQNGMPNGHVGWYDSVSHSSNRRNDQQTFATNVWNSNPY
jgi:hypothetical protein